MAMKSERSVMAAIRKRGEICAAGEFVSGARLDHTLSPYLAPEAQDAGNGNMRKEPARCHGGPSSYMRVVWQRGPSGVRRRRRSLNAYINRYHLLGVRHHRARRDVHSRTPPDRP